MPYPTVIHLIAEEFTRAGIRCIMVGGFAVNFYGVSRQTADADFLLQDGDYDAAADILRKSGYRELHRQDIFARWRSDNIHLIDVDFLFVDAATFGKVWQGGDDAAISGHSLRLPSLDHLIGMKLHALKHNPGRHGQKDLMDIVALAQQNHLDMRAEKYRSLCLRFGTEQIHRTILDLLER